MKAINEDALLAWFENPTTAAVHAWLREQRDNEEDVMAGGIDRGQMIEAALARGRALGIHLALQAVPIELERRKVEKEDHGEDQGATSASI